MNLSEIFIRRPVMTTLVMVGIVIFGLMGYQFLPISALPNVEYPFISVSASLPGATPETMASAVAAPLERQFSSIAGLNSFNSTSSTGSTNISLQFDFSRSTTDAAKDVQAAISAAAGQLPQNMPHPPTYRKVNPSVAPILYVYLYSDTLPISTVDEYAEVTLGQPISMIDGVAQVQVYGQQQYAVRVQVDPRELVTRGIGLDQVQSAIQQANVTLPTGSLSGKDKTYIIQADGQLKNAAAYRPLIITYKNGAPVRLQDVGQVIDSVQNNKVSNRYNGHNSVVLAVQPQPDGNTVRIVDAIKQLWPTLREQVPAAIEMGIMYDRSQTIRASVHDVQFTLFLSVCLVVLVIFLFLRDLAATLIPSLALPVAIVGTFAVMYILGYSLDNLSLMALTLSVGFVIDDAVVVLENIVRHREMGEPPLEAALNGSREIGFTIVSMTLSLVAVFIPMLFMGGLIGKLFHEFAVTIAVAILVSGFVSISLTPMLCSRFLKPHAQQRNRLYRVSERAFDFLLHGYEVTLKPVLQYRIITLIVSGIILVSTFYLFTVVPTGFIPTEDTGQIMANTKAAQDISFDDMLRHQEEIVNIIRKNPNIAAVDSIVGASGPNASANSGRITILLKPRSQRRLNSEQIIAKLRPRLTGIPGIQAFLRAPPAIPIGGQQTNSLYQYTLQSLNPQELYQYVPQLVEKIKGIPGLQDVNSDVQMSTPQLQVEIDHKKIATLGITAQQVESTLSSAYGSRQVSTIYGSNDQFYVILELQPQYQRDPNALSLLYIRASNGKMVPLNTIANITQKVSPLTLNHVSQIPSATISFNLIPNMSLGQATQAINQLASNILPSTVTASFQGSAQVFKQSFNDLGTLLAVSIIVIYLILGILYEDFIHPITILSGLPSAGFGALLTLLIFQVDLNLYSFIGIILLMGIVKKNGIMMVDVAIELQRNEGKHPFDAIYEACIIRFRPIMMTTMAALMGTLPIAIGAGSGSEARRPLGIAIVGGLVFSQILTLYLTPVFYTYMETWRKQIGEAKLGRIFFWKKRKKATNLTARE
ncbi:efflux RND transporter permease subunit [Aetokthonos hydrillicola Thurmond2011]|jgi:HAE1 family hydrophobic/amphiphilic exporter-1|uniref:Efflux RND transporter permease subunit n=1 Tax=Aetokthonos hydrillicola Thurmond2011 TaxID=2712845 RepID=A0AAP5I6N7_9CYAN|nr:efflux RND transporter permease subunit [Aetokthonos hydrillicola]MBO3461809.1 efflux RND transporter permease subunit [Aetokthonos hydrillicola CCALA 1050]MBW4589953.1 efflux RND transporter permease subunit [Aetokthonos hydrillicola CCALA 1050]MDR9895720.1 efflux RND transporter permease subunit [Aetokthonos hydrillicola Thurmond2011]